MRPEGVRMLGKDEIFFCLLLVLTLHSEASELLDYWQHNTSDYTSLNASEALMINNALELISKNSENGQSSDQHYLSDDPYVFDLHPYQEQGRLSVPALINVWNELVFKQHHESDFEESLKVRSPSKDCSVPCHPSATCSNGKCSCKAGFNGDGVMTCEDIDECKSPKTCQIHEECLNLFSSFECRCSKGFKGQTNQKGSTCVDVDECQTGAKVCSPSAICVNTEGSYVCTCPPGKILGVLGECVKPKLAPVLECKPDRLEIKVTKEHLYYFDPARKAMESSQNLTNLLYLMNNQTTPVLKECTLQPLMVAGNVSYRISIPFASCSTERVVLRSTNSTTIHYKNTLWWSSFFRDLPFIMMPYKMFEIDCKYSENTTPIIMNASSVIQNVSRIVERTGRANITMKFWRFLPGHPLSEPLLAVPLEYVLGEILYVTVELQQNQPLPVSHPYLRMDNCYISSYGSSAKVDIITNGCPTRDPSFKHKIITNGESPIGCFMFQMIQLQPPGPMFIKCDATLCKSFCKPMCYQGRKRRDANETSNKNQVRIEVGTIQFTSGPVSLVKPSSKAVKTEDKSVRENSAKTKGDESPSSISIGVKSGDITVELILPIMLIVANLSILIILGLISYGLARSVASNRRLKRGRRHREGLLDDTLGYVSFSPPTPLVTSGGGSGNAKGIKFNHTHSFCQDKDCHFMKDVKLKNHHISNKISRKKRQQLKESMFKPVVYDSSTLTCPTPFNSPPPSPPIEIPTFRSVGTSPIRSLDMNAPQ